ncbi:hypothetical protein ACJVDH_17840 [Pedobacter sp. AW1-32]|uniref:hypothetical protein n=1 Tax=Pedobacter sp. AW1-32 TaxID=3383026 RepID=UPI003FEEDEEE
MDNREVKHYTESMETANQPSIYKLIIVGVLISILGTYLRFAHDSWQMSLISWIVLFIGAIVAIKGVFKILGS